MADKIVVLKDGQIEQVGSPMELYNHPATPFVAGFIGSPSMNLYTGDVARRMGADVYGIRPEHLLIGEKGQWSGRIRHIERLGADMILHLEVIEMGEMLVRVTGDADLSIGQTIQVSPMQGREHRF